MSVDTDLLALQNGSDIRGIAISTEKHQANLTKERARQIGYAFVKWLESRTGHSDSLTIAIGQDSRLSGDELKEGLIEGMQSEGLHIIDCGLATTPAMFMATLYDEFKVDGAIMITASHLPFEYNGLKFFTTTGGAEHEDIEAILALAADYSEEQTAGQLATVSHQDLLSVYAKDLVEKIRKGITQSENPDKPLTGRHIVVDAGNGAGGFFVEQVLNVLGADTSGSQFLDPDGRFPNHESNPDNKEAMNSLKEAVLKSNADLGIIFDTDVDRSALVDSNGQALNRNNLIALISAVLLKEQAGATIVTNSATSKHLGQFLADRGGKHDLYLTGYRNVINRAIALDKAGDNAVLAIETSGHAAMKENYFLDDGAYLVAKLLMADAALLAEGKSLSDLIVDLKQAVETTEYRFVIEKDPIIENGNRIISDFKDFLRGKDDIELIEEHLEGVRANFSGKYGEGWFILRLSLHEPLLVWTMESDERGKLPTLIEDLVPFFSQQDELDKNIIIK